MLSSRPARLPGWPDTTRHPAGKRPLAAHSRTMAA